MGAFDNLMQKYSAPQNLDFVANIPRDENAAAEYAQNYGIPDDSNEKGIIGKAFDYLSKPSDAVAGVVVHGLQMANDTWRQYLAENPEKQAKFANPVQIHNIPAPTDESAYDALMRGWNKGASYTEAMDKEWKKENPGKAFSADLALKIGLDPLNVVTPSNVVRAVDKLGDATGVNAKVAKAAEAVAETAPGRYLADRTAAILDAHPLNSELSIRQLFSEEKQIGDLVDTRNRYIAQTEDAVRGVTDDLRQYTKPLGEQGSAFERLLSRYNEALPSGTVPKAKLEGRRTVFDTLQREVVDAKQAVNEAKGFEPLTEVEQRIADIAKEKGIPASQLGNATEVLRKGFEPIPKAINPGNIDPLVRPKAEALKLIADGKMTPEEYTRAIQMFSTDELRYTLPEMKKRHPNNQVLAEIGAGKYMPEQTIPQPLSKLEQEVLSAPQIVPELDSSLTVKPEAIDLKAQMPHLYEDVKVYLDGSRILPSPRVTSIPKTAAVQLKAKGIDLTKLSQAESDALRSVDPRDVSKLQEKIQQVTEYNKRVNKLEEAERALTRADVSPETTADVLKSALDAGFSPEQTSKIMEFGERMKKIANTQTMEALSNGLISVEEAGAYSGGRHLRRMYSSIDTPKQHYESLLALGKKQEAIKFLDAVKSLDKAARKSNLSLDMSTVIERQNLPKSLQDAYGRIYEASVPFARGSQLSAELIANQRLLKGVMERYAVDEASLLKLPKPENYIQFKPTGDGKWGPLEGMYVPKDIYSEVAYAIKNQPPGVWQQSVGVWKSLKTVWNPASWSRNLMSNFALMDINGIPFPQAMRYSLKAMNEQKRKGKYFDETRQNTNLLMNTFMRNELGRTMQQTGSETLLGKAVDAFKGSTERLGKGYNAVEVNGKLAVYMYAREVLKKDIKGAEAFANQVLFDYSKVPPIIEKLRNSGVIPFATFPYKSSQSVIKQLYENPTRITKYYRTIDMADDKDQKRLMPDYQRISLPIDKALQALGIDRTTRMVDGKPQKVQNRLDLKYILPFESATDIGLSPAVGIIKGLAGNRDYIDRDIVRKGMTDEQKFKAVGDFLYKSIAPNIAPPIPGFSEGGYTAQKLYNATTGRVDPKGRQYDLAEAVAHGVFGLKNSPINIEEAHKNKMYGITSEIRATASEIGRMKRDKSLSNAQKTELEKEYKAKIRELGKEAERQQAAYKRLKAKEGK
jgi:hypothetical protein